MGLIVSISGISLATGPLIGGLLLHWFSWRSIFFLNLPICLLVIATIFFTRKEFSNNEKEIMFKDYKGVFLLFVGSASNPLSNLDVFKLPHYNYALLLRMGYQFIFLGVLFTLPITLQNIAQFSSLKTGLLVLPLTLMMGFFSPLIGKRIDKKNSYFFILLRNIILVISCLYFAFTHCVWA